jgi:argininosuccinate lyase
MAELVERNYAAATELANFLVRDRGLAFRDCHRIVGSIVGTLAREGRMLADYARVQELLAESGQKVSVEELAETLEAAGCLRRQVSVGSTGPKSVAKMVSSLQEALGTSRQETAAAREGIKAARQHTDEVIQHVLRGGELEDVEL